MKVNGSYILTRSRRLKTSFLKQSKPITIHIPTENYDYKGIETGSMANLIHSLDASNIQILVKRLLEQSDSGNTYNLYTIHDCFASTLVEMKTVEQYVRMSFVELYFKQNYLADMHNSFVLQIKSYCDRIVVKDNNGVPKTYAILDKEGLELDIPMLPHFN